MKTVLSTNLYCQRQFGQKVYRLALSASTDCPNRQNGKGGCIFCSAGGSGDFAAPASWNIDRQIEYAKEKISRKTDAKKFIAYFQSFTGTYGDIDGLRQIYLAAAKRQDIAAVSIATRPDCLGPRVLEMLQEICAVKPLWIELGLQTASDRTADLIRRGYPTEIYIKAAQALRTLPIHLITHVIFGLPGETEADMMRSVALSGQYSNGVKLQLLHVLQNTELAEWYRQGKLQALTPQAYYELVAKALSILPEGIVVHRMTGDGNKKELIAPLWSADKKRVLNDLTAVLRQRGFIL